jgi:DNA polymerase-3 subunit epsilon
MIVAETSFAAVDFESAGVRRGSTEVPVQIGIALMCRREIVESFSSFLFTDQPITWAARKVHGICAQVWPGADDFALPEVHRLLETAGWWPMVPPPKGDSRAFPFHGFGPWVDTLKLARAVWPAMKSFALGDLILDLGLEEDLRRTFPGFRWHDALSDAMASLVLLRRTVAEAKVETQEAEILLRPDASQYHRLKAPGHPPRSGSRSPGIVGFEGRVPVSDI